MTRSNYKFLILAVVVVALTMTTFPALAQENFGGVADRVSGQLGAFGKLAMGALFLAGIGVAAGAAFKFKAHSENAQQTPLKIPLFWTIVAAILIAIPTFLSVGKTSLFGDNTGNLTPGSSGLDGYSF